MTQENNPDCPYCHKPMSFNGKQKSGAEVYRCRRGCKNENGKTPTVTLSDRKRGRPTKGAIAMSQAELDKRYRENNPEKYREIHKKKRAKKNK
jgi:hypothetical protein